MYDLDSEGAKWNKDIPKYSVVTWDEIDILTNVDEFTDPDSYVNTGFSNSIQYTNLENADMILSKSLVTNEKNSLCFGYTETKENGIEEIKTIFTGAVYRSYAWIDYIELQKIKK